MQPKSETLLRKITAAVTLSLSLVLCAVAGQLPESAAVFSPLDGSSYRLRVDYISGYGWEVGAEQEDTVILPEEFGDAYNGYLALQRECGFDLEALAGQTVTRYCYPILNYPTGETGVLLDLLVFEGQIVGGDIRTAQLDGFMHSLLKNR